MSRRTYPRFAAGLFAAALTAPLLLAQPSNPWRGQSTNPWRNAAAGVAAEGAQPDARPRARVMFKLGVFMPFGNKPITTSYETWVVPPADAGSADAHPACCKGGCCSAAAAAPMPREKHACSNQEFRIEFVDSGTVAPRVFRNQFPYSFQDVQTAAVPQLAGTWYRETPTMVVAFAVTGNEMKITLTTNTGEGVGTATITADCAVTRDGTVHGVFTGADVDVTAVKDARLGMELAELQLDLQELVDQPFAFRCRPADGGLMVSNVRLPGSDQAPHELMLCGKYKTATGPIPTPKPAPIIAQFSTDPNELPAMAYPPYPLAYPPAVYPGQVCVGMPPPAPCPVPMPTTRYGPPPEVRDTMIRVFAEMMNGPGAGLPACPGPLCLPPGSAYPMACPPGYPPADIAQATYPFPVPPPPPPAPVAATVAARAGQLPVGTWCREVGPIRYKIDAKDGHLTVTLTVTDKVDGRTATMDYTLIAECYPTRTEGEVVGLITGFDIAAGDKALDLSEAGDLLKDLPKLQQALEGKPIALTFRSDGDSLVVGKVRMPPVKNEDGEASAMFAAMGGRYTSSPKPTTATKTKAGKRAAAGMTLPSPNYLEHNPQHFPADPAFPLPRELANQIDPASDTVPPMLPPAPVPTIPRSK